MKKLMAMLCAVGALALTACKPTMYSAEGTSSTMKANGYTAEVYTYEEAKVRIQGLNYELATFTNAMYASKGTGDDKDFILAFFFSSLDDTATFMNGNDYQNMALLHSYGEQHLGEHLTLSVGTHNNVAYVGSETTRSLAFGL